MVVAWDDFGRAAQKRGIEGQVTIILPTILGVYWLVLSI